jgi:3',5'-cyclic-AMP phosphodiesterase
MQGLAGARSYNLVRIHNRTFVSAVVPVGEYPRMNSYITAEETKQRLKAASISIPSAVENEGGTPTGLR